MPPLKNIAFLINRSKEGAPDLGSRLMKLARSKGANVTTSDAFPVPRGYLEGRDACCVIGGDGTLLSAVEESSRSGVPLLGINRGSLGFLTTVAADEAVEEFNAVLEGNYTIARRSMLECRGVANGGRGIALNDVVIKEEKSGRLVPLGVHADGELVTDFLCDGLIFSTPTGSTAYNLSAGGPIIEPHAEVIAMTPICPHTLSNRAVIFHEKTRIRVNNPGATTRLAVALDGRPAFSLAPSEELAITLAGSKLPLIQNKNYSHFSVVRTKLGWIGGR